MLSSTKNTMTSVNTTLSESSKRAMLEDLASTNFLRLLPIVIFCGLLAALGSIGNSLSVYVFLVRMRRNFMNDLFILLSGTSLLACAVCLPGEIFDMYNAYVYPSSTVCKVGRYFNLLSTICLVTTLFTLALYRLRAAQASGSQSLLLRTRLLIFSGILGWTFGFSLFGFRVYGIKTLEVYVTIHGENTTQLLIGRDCAVADDVAHTFWPMTYNLSMIAGFLLLTITTVVCYYRIWRLVVRSRLAVAAHVTKPVPANENTAATSGTVADDMAMSVSDAPDDVPQNQHGGDTQKTGVNGNNENSNGNSEPQVYREIYPDIDVEKQASSSEQNGGAHKDTTHLLNDNNYDALGRNSTSACAGHSRNFTSDIRNVETSGLTDLEIRHVRPFSPNSHLGGTENSKNNVLSVIEEGQSIPSQSTVGYKGFANKDTVLNTVENTTENRTYQASVSSVTVVSNQSYNINQGTPETATPPQPPPTANSKPADTETALTRAPNKTPVELFRATSFKRSRPRLSIKISLKSRQDSKDAGTGHSRKAPKSSLESNITKTALLLAVTFILCYVPFFCVSIPSLFIPGLDYGNNVWSLNFTRLAYRLYFVTPAINPLIFYASNLDFRRKIKELLVTRQRSGR